MIITFVNAKTCGKTALLCNFAVVLAKTVPNKKIALIDLNIQTPEVAHYFNLIDESNGKYPMFLDEIFRYLSSGEDYDIESVLTSIKGVPNLSLICGPHAMREDFARFSEIHWTRLISKLKGFDVVLVDTPRFQNSPLFKGLYNASHKLVLVQDQDLFGAYHVSQMIRNFDQESLDKLEFWLCRYEAKSPIRPLYIEENTGLVIKYQIPSIPRDKYNLTILKDKAFGQDEITNYTPILRKIAKDLMRIKDEKDEFSRWKFWKSKGRSQPISTNKFQKS